MSYNAKNYTEQGGEVTHIGGQLIFEEGASVEGLPCAENQADSTASTVAGLVTDFNGLLTKLKAAGLMAADEEPESQDTPSQEETPEVPGEEEEPGGDNGNGTGDPA